MATITGHYNVTVESRYYAFLQDDMESAEPHVLMASVEKKRELRKENKTKAKKEKRSKQIAEQTKENVKIESNVEEVLKIEAEIVESKGEPIEKPEEISEPVLEEKNNENKSERGYRGRGNIRRQNGNSRRGGFPRNEERSYNDDEGSQQKSQDSGYNKFVPSNRGRPFRKERSEGESQNKVGYFDEQSGPGNRGNPPRRRPSGRGSGRFNRGNDRNANDRNPNDRYPNDRNTNDRYPNDRNTNDRYPNDRNANDRYPNDRNANERYSNDRNTYDRNSNEKSTNDRNVVDRNGNEEKLRTDIIPESMGTFEEMSIRPPRSSRGRYPRSNRGGFNRHSGPPFEGETDFDNKIGYFEENMENREYRGNNRGRSRGSRGGMRRGRGGGEFWRPRGNDRDENSGEGFTNNFKPDNRDEPVTDKWLDVDEELGGDPISSEPVPNVEADFNDVKKSNWGEIEDDPVELKPANEHMTLEEWRALHGKDRLLNQEGKENRKANDGEDVFSGMEEYRKGRFVEEQGDEHDIHDNQHGRQKQAISVAIRFSRNTEYGTDSNSFDQTTTVDNNRNFVRSGSGSYYNNENRYRGENAFGGRGRSRGGGGGGGGGGGSDFNTYGRGRDFNRGRGGGGGGRFNRNSYPVTRKDDHPVNGVNINLGNEEEFPTLS